jgi:hypothetical protein
MDRDKYARLRQLQVAKPCHENWDAMSGDDQRRFCDACGCHVHNIADYTADEATELLAQPGRVCTRIIRDEQKGILTKSGWLSRLAVASAAAAMAAGCVPHQEVEPPPPVVGKLATYDVEAKPIRSSDGKTAPVQVIPPVQGTPAVPRRVEGDETDPNKIYMNREIEMREINPLGWTRPTEGEESSGSVSNCNMTMGTPQVLE